MVDWPARLAAITTGPIPSAGREAMPEESEILIGALEDRGIEFEAKSVLDIGCGNGRAAIALTTRGLARYVGFDIVGGAIEFCRGAFADWPEFSFVDAGLANSRYNPKGRSALRYQFPAEDHSVDVAIAFSVFTHLDSRAECLAYLFETWRVLADDGVAWLTFFTNPPNETCEDAARVVYPRAWLLEAIAAAGFEIVHEAGGTTTGWHDQVQMELRPKRRPA